MEPRFVVDVNVGRLAKWLRVMGYDAPVPSVAEDNNLVRLALREGRIMITKDSKLMERRVVTSGQLKAVLIRHDDLKSQLQQVVEALGLKDHKKFSRCIRCSLVLIPVPKASVEARVPPYVYETQEVFMACPGCHRLYWRGTHWANMAHDLVELGVI